MKSEQTKLAFTGLTKKNKNIDVHYCESCPPVFLIEKDFIQKGWYMRVAGMIFKPIKIYKLVACGFCGKKLK